MHSPPSKININFMLFTHVQIYTFLLVTKLICVSVLQAHFGMIIIIIVQSNNIIILVY